VLSDGEEPVEIGWSPAGPMLEFGMGEESVRAYAIAGSASRAEGASNGPGVAWELPAAGFAAIRTIWAVTEKGDLLLLVAVRPEGAASHEEEVLGAARIFRGAEPYGSVEPLLSTEYDAAGLHTRATRPSAGSRRRASPGGSTARPRSAPTRSSLPDDRPRGHRSESAALADPRRHL
jgi:hypothetical protein